MQTKTFVVPNISCDGCVRTVKNAINDVPGAEFVAGDEALKQVTVKWDAPADWDQITAALVEMDYAPGEEVAG